MNHMIALTNEEGVVEQLALFTDYGAFTRDEGDWVPAPVEDDDQEDPIDGMVAIEATDQFLPIFDMADETDATLTEHDVV